MSAFNAVNLEDVRTEVGHFPDYAHFKVSHGWWREGFADLSTSSIFISTLVCPFPLIPPHFLTILTCGQRHRRVSVSATERWGHGAKAAEEEAHESKSPERRGRDAPTVEQ